MTSPAIFICYRRADVAHAGRLAISLQRDFGESNVFFDETHLDVGDEWSKEIQTAVFSCRVFLVVISPQWNLQRLHEPDDVVANEIRLALLSEARVNPILVNGAKLPNPQELPESLQAVTERQAFEIDDSHWRAGYRELSRSIRGRVRPKLAPWVRFVALAIAVGALSFIAGYFVASRIAQRKISEQSIVPIDVPANVRAVTGPLAGIDLVSRRIDWSEFDATHIDFVYLDARPEQNPHFSDLWAELKSHHVRRGAYLLFGLDADPVKQADSLAAAVNLENDDLPLAIEFDPSLSSGFDHAATGERLRQCLTELETRSGRRPLLRVTSDWRSDYGDFSTYALWVVNDGPVGSTNTPAPWKTWTFWQHATETDMRGLGSSVNIDYFQGNRDALEAFIAQSRVPH